MPDLQRSCPACGAKPLADAFYAGAYPALIFPVDPSASARIPRAPLTVLRCLTCRHEFQPDPDLELAHIIYSELYEFYPYSTTELMDGAYRQPFTDTFKMVAPSEPGGTVLEIGCNSVEALSPFIDMGLTATGISPDAVECESAGATLIKGFFEDAQFDQQFDFIVSRFNLEHIAGIQAHVERIYDLLKPGGTFVAQVPNADAFRANGMSHIYAHEHVHYFTPRSMEELLVGNGLVVSHMTAPLSPSILVVSVRDSAPQVPTHQASDEAALLERLRDDRGAQNGNVCRQWGVRGQSRIRSAGLGRRSAPTRGW